MGLRKVDQIGNVPDYCGLPVRKLLLNLRAPFQECPGDECSTYDSLNCNDSSKGTPLSFR